MEMHVLSDRRLNSIAEWQQAIDAEGFPLRLSPTPQFEAVRGFLPAQLERKKTGFECYHDNANDMMDFDRDFDFGHRWTYALGFRWIGDFAEFEAAWMAAAAYARATDGVVFDPQEDRLFTPSEAVEFVRKIKRELPAIEAAVREVSKKFAGKS
jgi:hypothetical protein